MTQMSEIELQYPRDDAIRMVLWAFENVRTLSSYRIDDREGVVTARMRGSVASLGTEITVSIPYEQPGDRTVISVKANRRLGLDRNANPWKHKAEFVQELNELRGRPVSEIPIVRAEDKNEGGSNGDDPPPPESDRVHMDMINEGTKLIARLVVLGLGLMAIVALLALVF